MKVLIDAQPPRRFARRLHAAGHDAIHTLELPAGNRTTDAEICRIADSVGRAVVTKDADLVSSFDRTPISYLRANPPMTFTLRGTPGMPAGVNARE